MAMNESGHEPLDVTVLIADDYAFIRHVIEASLARQRLAKRVLHAANGAAALLELGVVMVRPLGASDSMPSREDIRISPSPVDILITDFNMPGANGLHILQMIRTGNTGVSRDTPVIMLTGFSDHPLLAAALALDVDAFVTKPVAAATLVEKFEAALYIRHAQQSAEAYGRVELPDLDLHVENPEISKERLENIRLRQREKERRGKSIGRNGRAPPRDDAIPLRKLEAGWILSEDLLSNSERVLLTKGTVLTEGMIARLKELSSITGVHEVHARPAPAAVVGGATEAV